MNAERFAELAGAYGGDIARWPAGERDAARAWRAGHREAASVLAEAGSLDAFLNAGSSFTPSLTLTAQVVKSAASKAAVKRPRTWISGAALAAACAAGVVLGANFSDSLFADPLTDTLHQTATDSDGASYFATTESAG